MRLNRTHKRPLEFSRGPADRDPMFEPIWYDGAELTVTLHGPTKTDIEFELASLPPESGLELRWKAALEKANEVTDYMHKHEPVYDRHEVFMAVADVIHTDFTPADVLAAYRKRMEAKRAT